MRHDDQEPEDEGRSRAEKGQIIILFAMFSTVLIGMLGLAMDLGFAFAQKRTVQNAADAAAMAGARQVAHYKDAMSPAAYDEANRFATKDENKMTDTQSINPPKGRCEYIDDSFKAPPDLTLKVPCTDLVPDKATGVHVKVEETHDTFFIRVVPGAPDTVPITAEAAARVELLRNVPKDAPFILCGSSAWAIRDKPVPPATTGNAINQSKNIVTPDGKIDPAAVGYTFAVRFNEIGTGNSGAPKTNANCNTPDGWKGMATGSSNRSTTVPGWFDYHTGTQVGADFTQIQGVGGCVPPNFKDCVMYLPVAINTPTPANKEVWVVGFAPFLIHCEVDNCQDISGLLLDNFIGSGPSDPGWNRDISDVPVVIRMIQ